MNRPRVVVVGDLAVDVLVTPTASPLPGADVPARIATTPGGAGANTAAWLVAGRSALMMPSTITSMSAVV